MLNIGKQLKCLRREKEITQEQLAGFLGVSPQAVSKWEREEGYPDITLLPTIATFFDTTIDELMGMAQIREQQQISQIQMQVKQNGSMGKIEENIVILRKALLMYPNHYKFMVQLADVLPQVEQDKLKRKEAISEAVEILERVSQFCADQEVCMEAKARLCVLYGEIGEVKKARVLGETLPSIWEAREIIMTQLLEGEEKIVANQEAIFELVLVLINQVKELENSYKTVEGDDVLQRRVPLLEKNTQLLKWMFEEEEYHFYHSVVCDNYAALAELYIAIGDKEKAQYAMEQVIGHAKAFDELPNQIQYKSVLIDKLFHNKENLYKSSHYTLSELFNEHFREQRAFKEIVNEGFEG